MRVLYRKMPLALKLVLRNFKSYPFYTSISILCLSLGITCSFFVVQWLSFELSFDRFHKNHERIYRLTVEKNDPTAGYHSHFARSWYGWLNDIEKEIPGIKRHARITHWYGGIVKLKEKVFDAKLFFTTPDIFNVLSFDFVQGSSTGALTEPFTLVLSTAAAAKYFGNVNPVGKSMEVYCRNCREKKEYTITGVVENFPVNSHFHFDILAAYENPDEYSGWAYHYLLLEPGSHPESVIQKFPDFAVKYINDEETEMLTPHLQNITDIHLKSHKARELEENNNTRNLFIFVALGIFVFGIALFNFINLQYVRILKKFRTIMIFKYNGSDKRDLYWYQLTESASLSIVAVILGYTIFQLLIGPFNTMMGMARIPFQPVVLYSIPIVFTVSVLAGMVPIAGLMGSGFILKVINKKDSHSDFALKDNRLMRISKYLVTLQYVATIILFITVFTVTRQINFFMNNRLGDSYSEIINVKNLPVQVTDKYQVFKEELMRHSSILDVTSSMEDPADESMDMMPFETSGIKENIENKMLYVYPVDDNFFPFYNIGFLSGRSFKPFDGSNLGQENYILNEKATKVLGWTPDEAVGKPFTLKFFMNDSNFFNGGQVVGVVEDFQMASMKNEIKPFVFFQKSFWLFSAQIKIKDGVTAETLEHIENVWNSIYTDFPFEYNFVENLYKAVYRNEFQIKKMGISLGVIALILSGLGLLSITGILFQTKTKEIGIRKVNGATSISILRMLVREYSKWIVLAIIIASPLAWVLLNKWLQNYVHKIEMSWWIFFISGVAVYVIAMLTVSWQSWITAGKNPVDSLKYE